jgi:hypothetical protein
MPAQKSAMPVMIKTMLPDRLDMFHASPASKPPTAISAKAIHNFCRLRIVIKQESSKLVVLKLFHFGPVEYDTDDSTK